MRIPVGGQEPPLARLTAGNCFVWRVGCSVDGWWWRITQRGKAGKCSALVSIYAGTLTVVGLKDINRHTCGSFQAEQLHTLEHIETAVVIVRLLWGRETKPLNGQSLYLGIGVQAIPQCF